MTGNIIASGTEAFTPAISKTGAIFQEFSMYIIYIAVACLWVYLMYWAVKMIIFEVKDNVMYKTRWKRKKARRNMKKRRTHQKRENKNKYKEYPF